MDTLHTKMEFSVKKGDRVSFKVACIAGSDRVMVGSGTKVINMDMKEAEQLVRVLQHGLARYKENEG